MYNKRALNVDLGKFTKPNPYKDDILYTEQGQWEFPGQPTRIPSNDITMEGVPYPVYGIDNTGYEQMMYPGEDYTFPGDYVDEYPMAKRGGYMQSLPKKKSSKRYSRSLTATNKLFTKNPLFKNTRVKKNRIFDPNARYYQDGGIQVEGYSEDSPWLGEQYKDLGATLTAGRFNLSAGNYFPTKVEQPTSNFNPYINLGVDLNKNRNLSFEYTPGYAGVTFTKSFEKGGFHDDIDKRRQVLRDWTYGKSIGMLQEPDGGYIELDLSEEEIDQYRKGGYIVEDLTQAQKGGRKPIYTSDPNDPRLQAYRDSLTLHNVSVRDVNYIRSLKPGDPFKPSTNQEFIDARRRLNNPDFERTGTITNNYWTRGKNYGIHKKPTQPVYFKKSKSKPKAVKLVESQSKSIEQIVPEPIQVENTPSVQLLQRDRMILPLGRSYHYEGKFKQGEGGQEYYGEFEKIIDPSSKKVRYVPTGKKSNFTTLQDPTFEIGGFMVEDISVPTLTKAEYGMPMGTGISQNYMGSRRTLYQAGGMLSDKQYAAGGAASPTDLNPETMKKYKQALKVQENSIKAGYNKAQDRWYPHASVEGGNKTVGYGHKVTDAEISKYNKGVTSGQIEDLLTSDILKHQAIAEGMIDKKYGKGTFDRLPQISQMLLVDYAYNGVLGKFPTFTDAVVKKNKNVMLKEYERSSGGKKLTERNNWTRGLIESNYQDGGPIELELTPEEIDWYVSQGYEVEDID